MTSPCKNLDEMLIEEKDSEMDREDIDFSTLPPHMVPGVQILSLAELIRCVSNGTEELRYYLLQESNTIIECKVCFNLFRNVGYFIAHKRFYCLSCNRDKATNSSATPPTYDGQSVTIAPELPADATDFKKQSVELVKKNLLKTPSSLLYNYGSTREGKKGSLWKIYNRSNKLTESKKEISNSVSINFEPIDNTNVAMKVVTLDETKDYDADSTDLNNQEDISDILPDIEDDDLDDQFEKELTSEPTSARSSPTPNDDVKELESNIKYELADFKHLKCLKCQRIMSSKKSLVNHVINLHGDLKRYYSCPLCKEKLKFRYFWGVIRHLSTIHYMKKLQINKIRSTLRKSSWVERNSGEIVSAPVACKTKSAAFQANNKSKKTAEDKIRLKNEEIAFANDLLQQKALQGILSDSSKGRKKFRCQSCKKVFTQIKSLQTHLRDCTDWEHVTKSSSDFKQNGHSSKKSQAANKAPSETVPTEQSKNTQLVSSNRLPKILPKPTEPAASDSKMLSVESSANAEVNPQSASVIPANVSNWTNPQLIAIGNNTCSANNAVTPATVPLVDQPVASVPCIVRPLQTNTLSTVSVKDLPILLPTTTISGSSSPAISTQNSTNLVCSVGAANTLCLPDKHSENPNPVIMSAVNNINTSDNNQIPKDTIVPNVLASVDKKGQISLTTILLPSKSQIPNVEKPSSVLITNPSKDSNENESSKRFVGIKCPPILPNGHVSNNPELQPMNDIPTLLMAEGKMFSEQKREECKTTIIEVDNFDNFGPAKHSDGKESLLNFTKSVDSGVKSLVVDPSNVSIMPGNSNSPYTNIQLALQKTNPTSSADSTLLTLTSQDLIQIPENSGINSQHFSKRKSKNPRRSYQKSSLKSNTMSIRDTKSALHSLIDRDSPKCIQCNRVFSKMSHVRRHAIRHLGWKRYKCKFCSFSNYERSECKTHIKRRHLGKIAGLTIKLLDFYIVDLNNNDTQITNSSSSSSSSSSNCDSKSVSRKKEANLNSVPTCTTPPQTTDDKIEEYTTIESVEHIENVSDSTDYEAVDLDSTHNDTSVSKSNDHAVSTSKETNSVKKQVEKQDSEKILALIDTKSLKCLECSREFQKRSHLRRHIVRHLGLKRYKCKQCKFTSYDRSECRSHIERCHLGKVQGITVNSINCSILMLGQPEEQCQEDQTEDCQEDQTEDCQEDQTEDCQEDQTEDCQEDQTEDCQEELSEEQCQEELSEEQCQEELSENCQEELSENCQEELSEDCQEELSEEQCQENQGWNYQEKETEDYNEMVEEEESEIIEDNVSNDVNVSSVTTAITFTESPISFNSLLSSNSENSKMKVNKKTSNATATQKRKSPSKQGSSAGSVKQKKSSSQVTSSKPQISPKKIKKVSSTPSSVSPTKKLLADDLSVLNTRKGYYVKPNYLQLARSGKKSNNSSKHIKKYLNSLPSEKEQIS